MPPEEQPDVVTTAALIDKAAYESCRAELGSDLPRILGYFREDGFKSVDAIEKGVRAMNAAALVMPAHMLKGEARQFGASPLAVLAEAIEEGARICVEQRVPPDDLIVEAARLRGLFEASLEALERASSPLVERTRPRMMQPRMVFGRNEP